MARFDIFLSVDGDVKLILTKQAFDEFCKDIYDNCIEGEKNNVPYISMTDAKEFEQYPEGLLPVSVSIFFLAYNYSTHINPGSAWDFAEIATKNKWEEKLTEKSKKILKILMDDTFAVAISKMKNVDFTLVYIP